MAIISATIDTDTDVLSVAVNGTDVPNVADITIYTYLDYENRVTSCVSIGSILKDDTTGLVTRTYISKAGVSSLPPETEKVIAEIQGRIKCR